MKRKSIILSLILSVLVLNLVGCKSKKSGGGGGASPTITTTEIKNAILGNNIDFSTIKNKLTNEDINITGDADNFSITYENAVFKSYEFRKNTDNGLVENSQNIFVDEISGTATFAVNDITSENGVHLRYSNFGYLKDKVSGNFSEDGYNIYFNNATELSGFTFGNDSKHVYNFETNTHFEGNAFGNVYVATFNDSNNLYVDSKELKGKAILNIDNNRNKNLTIDYDNYYTFTYINNNNANYSNPKNNNIDNKFNLDNSIYNGATEHKSVSMDGYSEGQYATEYVGTHTYYKDTDTNFIEVDGVFGVVKK